MAVSNGLNPTFTGLVSAGTGIAATAAGAKVATFGAISLYLSTGAPTVSAAKGSLCINTSATTTTTRLYINTDGGTTWASFTASA